MTVVKIYRNMKYQEFEDGLAKKFEGHTVQVDVDALINNLDKNDKKRPLFWIPILAFGIALISTFAYFTLSEDSNDTDTKPSNSIVSTAPHNPQPSSASSFVATASQDSEKSEVSILEDQNNKTPESMADAKTSIVSISNNRMSTEKNITQQAQPAFSKPESKIHAVTSKPINTQHSQNTFTHTGDKSPSETTSSLVKSSKQVTESNTTLSRDIVDFQLLNGYDALLDFEERMMDMDPRKVKCPSFGDPTEWYIDIIPTLGGGIPQKSLDIINFNDDVYALRDQQESPLEVLTASLTARVSNNKLPVYIRGGAAYSRLTERMKLNITYVERDTTVGIISITQSQNGDTLTVIQGDIITETEYTRKSSDHYYLHLIDIPVSIGYLHDMKNGWRVGGELGAQLNLSLKAKGKILETPSEYTELPAAGRFKNSLGLSYFGGLSIERQIGEVGAFYINPQVRYIPNSLNPSSYGLEQKYTLYSLNVGYVHYL